MRDQRTTTTMSHSEGLRLKRFTASCGVSVAIIGLGEAGSSQLTTSKLTRPLRRPLEGNSSLRRCRVKARSSRTSPGEERKTRMWCGCCASAMTYIPVVGQPVFSSSPAPEGAVNLFDTECDDPPREVEHTERLRCTSNAADLGPHLEGRIRAARYSEPV